MVKELISGVIYTEFDDFLGPNPVLWLPGDLDEETRRLVSLKSITLLSGEEMYIPDSLVIIPFGSIGMKGIVKYVEWEQEGVRGGRLLSAITLLFKEANDLIFYKYLKHLRVFFDEMTQIARNYKVSGGADVELLKEFRSFHDRLIVLLEELRTTEIQDDKELVAFPESDDERKEYVFKVVVCGDPEVGKTSTILSFTDKAFKRTYIPTIGVNITEKSLFYDKDLIQFTIWDIAGQEKFGIMRTHFYKGLEGLLVIFDLTRPETLKSAADWYKDVLKCSFGVWPDYSVLLGNKSDLVDERKVSEEEARELAESLGIEYVETSALTGENVEQVFYKLAEILVNSRRKLK